MWNSSKLRLAFLCSIALHLCLLSCGEHSASWNGQERHTQALVAVLTTLPNASHGGLIQRSSSGSKKKSRPSSLESQDRGLAGGGAGSRLPAGGDRLDRVAYRLMLSRALRDGAGVSRWRGSERGHDRGEFLVELAANGALPPLRIVPKKGSPELARWVAEHLKGIQTVTAPGASAGQSVVVEFVVEVSE